MSNSLTEDWAISPPFHQPRGTSRGRRGNFAANSPHGSNNHQRSNQTNNNRGGFGGRGRAGGGGGGSRFQNNQRTIPQPVAPPVINAEVVRIPPLPPMNVTVVVVLPSVDSAIDNPESAVPVAEPVSVTATESVESNIPDESSQSLEQIDESIDNSQSILSFTPVIMPPPLATSFDLSPEQQNLTDFVNSLYEDDSISLSTASLLRWRIFKNDSEILRLVENSLTNSLPLAASNDLDVLIKEFITIERLCFAAQLNEIEVLRAIFPNEMTVSSTFPIIVTVIVQLDSVDCRLELNFLLPAGYPLRDEIYVKSFIPPPFNQYFTNDDNNESSLQSTLNKQALLLKGDESGAIYSLIETARQFIAESSMEQKTRIDEEFSQSLAHSLYTTINESEFSIDGRGKIETEINSLIKTVEETYGLNRANSKALLKESLWDIKKIKPKTNSSSSPASSSSPLSAFSVLDDETMIENLKSCYENFNNNSFQCLSCLEDFQSREGLLLIQCQHFLCFQCYSRYVITLLNTGSSFVRCPGHKCEEFVDEGILFSLLSLHDNQRYRRFIQDSFLTLQSSRWCVNEKCGNISRAKNPLSTIICYCSAVYCFQCGESAHFPLACGERIFYYSSVVIQDLRAKHDLLMKLEAQLEDDSLLVIQTKPCPKCKTSWERSEGCNHMKCPKCSHHYCYVCLQDWAIHGISWFECPYQATREVRASKIMFSENDALVGSESEILLSLIGRECEATNNMSRALTVKLNSHNELNLLLLSVEGSTMESLLSLLSSLIRIHSLLQHIFICLTQYKSQLIPNKLTLLTKQLLNDLNQWEYFIEIINSALLRSDLVRGIRANRSMKQLKETEKAVIKYGKVFIETFKLFLKKEAKAPKFEEDEDNENNNNSNTNNNNNNVSEPNDSNKSGNLAAFLTHLDRVSGKAGKSQVKFDIAPPVLFHDH